MGAVDVAERQAAVRRAQGEPRDLSDPVVAEATQPLADRAAASVRQVPDDPVPEQIAGALRVLAGARVLDRAIGVSLVGVPDACAQLQVRLELWLESPKRR